MRKLTSSLSVVFFVIIMVPKAKAMESGADDKKHLVTYDLKKILLGQLVDLAEQIVSTKNLNLISDRLSSVALILNQAFEHGVVFSDDEINPCKVPPNKEVFFQLMAACYGCPGVIDAFAQHNVIKRDFSDDKGRITIALMMKIASDEARRSYSDDKNKYLKTIFALDTLNKKQEKRALLPKP